MRLAYTRRGSGEPLVLLHGITDQGLAWRPVVGLLASTREVWTLDLPGHGASPTLRNRPPTVGALAAAVAGFMREHGVERFHVVGNSLGGGIAIELGRTGVARSVCGISPIGFYNDLELRFLRASLRTTRGVTRTLLPAAERLSRHPLIRVATSAQLVRHGDRVPAEDMAERVTGIALCPGFAPTLEHAIGWRYDPAEPPACAVTIAWGEHDLLLPTRPQSRRARQLLPQAEHVILRGCGHVPTWDDPEQVAAVILRASAVS